MSLTVLSWNAARRAVGRLRTTGGVTGAGVTGARVTGTGVTGAGVTGRLYGR